VHHVVNLPWNINIGGNVLADELESWVVEQVRDVGFIASDEIIQTYDLVTLINETICQV
jgi:hypothetical protein